MGVVGAETGDCGVVNVGYEAGGGVEVCVVGVVEASEEGGGVGVWRVGRGRGERAG